MADARKEALRGACIKLYGQAGLTGAEERLRGLETQAGEIFGGGVEAILSAPGRTELIGNHTDHNNGRVLAAAVRLDCLALARARTDAKIRFFSNGFPPVEMDISDLAPRPEEANATQALVRGIANYFKERSWSIGGFECVADPRVPAGSGMSSSACVEVLIALVFSELFNQGKIPWVDLALAGQYAENAYFGKPCGLMDQMACSGGGVLDIDFAVPGKPKHRGLTLDIDSSGYALALTQTGGSHADLTPHYAAIPAEMKSVAALFGHQTLSSLSQGELLAESARVRRLCGDRALLRALHFIAENARVESAAATLARGDFQGFLDNIRASGISSWTLLQNVDSGLNPAAQGLSAALGLSQAYLGSRGACRVHGGGFAGTIQAFVPKEDCLGYTQLMEGNFGKGSVLYPGLRPVGVSRLA